MWKGRCQFSNPGLRSSRRAHQKQIITDTEGSCSAHRLRQCTELWTSRLRSGSAHWDLEPAVEARQCPLSSQFRPGTARSWGPAMEFAVGRNEGKDGRRKYITLIIQYLDPHLIGGEKQEPHPKMRGHKNAASMVFLRFPIFSKVFPCLVNAFLPPWPSRQPRALNALSRTARRLARQSGVLETKIGCSQNFTNVHKISPVHVNKRYIRLY